MRASRAHLVGASIAAALAMTAASARAQLVAAEPTAPIEAPPPERAPPIEVQVDLAIVVDAAGQVESAVVASRLPADAPASFADAAVEAAKKAHFTPSTRDGQAIRSRVEYVVVFHPPPAPVPAPVVTPPSPPSPPPAMTTNEPDEDYAQTIDVHGVQWSSPRGLGDVRIKRELLDAAPHQQTSEMLSAAPGFFVDHEDGEGLGNDVYLRGFDLDHGSGIEMRLGSIPINIPTHIQGQGYADANFIIPEVVRSIRVLEGPYDPRQGDAAIVGSAYFDLGVPERGYHVQSTFGSFDQVRVVGIAAPVDADEDTFVAFSLRSTNGFGESRASQSGSINAQYGFDIGARDRLKLVATAYGARSLLAGVVRQDDVDARRIGFYDSYANNGEGQSVQSSRVVLGADFDHVAASGARFEFAPWFMWTDFRARQNFTGELETAQLNLATPPSGDLFESTNLESAAGLTSRMHSAPWVVGDVVEVTAEPGVTLRAAHTNQTRSLLDPADLQPWDRRIDAALQTFDAGAYLDVDVRLWKRLRLSGGPRADLLLMTIDDHLANLVPAGTAPANALPGGIRDVEGIAAGPRLTAAYELTRSITPVVSYGEGFRSLDAQSLQEGSLPYSKIRSAEAGVRVETPKERVTASVAAFETWVANELVFEAAAGGFETESASIRRGVVGSLVARPTDWLLASTALTVTDATFSTLVAGVGHFVPSVPPVLFRADVAIRGALTTIAGKPLNGRLGVGYTFLSGKHLTDTIVGPSSNVLNAKAAVRYTWLEVGFDAYNVLNLRYADDAEVYVSNWSNKPGQQPASVATHLTAAPPLTLLGTIAVHL
jgi:iron complex outermembrane receptor protein